MARLSKKSKENPANDRDFGLWRLLNHTRFMIFRLREKELSQCGLTPEQAHILDILAHSKGATTINEIAEITQLQHHSVSTQIGRMARLGLVRRKRNESDKRGYEVSITREGRIVFGKVTTSSVRSVFSCLPVRDKKILSSYLTCLLERAYRLNGKDLVHFPGKELLLLR